MARGTGSHDGDGALVTHADVSRDLLNRHQRTGNMYRWAVLLFGALFILGVIALVILFIFPSIITFLPNTMLKPS